MHGNSLEDALLEIAVKLLVFLSFYPLLGGVESSVGSLLQRYLCVVDDLSDERVAVVWFSLATGSLVGVTDLAVVEVAGHGSAVVGACPCVLDLHESSTFICLCYLSVEVGLLSLDLLLQLVISESADLLFKLSRLILLMHLSYLRVQLI